MSDKKAAAHPNIPNGFHIPVDAETLEAFPHQRAVALVLNESHRNHDAFQKQIPGHLAGKEHKGKAIHWINNFGLKETGKDTFADVVPEYEILLDAYPGAEYVYYDGKDIRLLPTQPHSADKSKVRAVLKLGDPPIGWTG